MKHFMSVFLPLMLMLQGCRTVSFTDHSGNSLQINSLLWDTQIGSLTASNGTDTITLNNYNSQPDQMALQLADDIFKSASVAASPLPSTPSTPSTRK